MAFFDLRGDLLLIRPMPRPLQRRIIARVLYALLLRLLYINTANKCKPSDTQAKREGKACPSIARTIDDDSRNNGADPGGGVAHQRIQREEGDFLALGANVAQHRGGEGVKGGDEQAVEDGVAPDFPDLVEPEFGGSDADATCSYVSASFLYIFLVWRGLTPDGDHDQKAANGHEHGLGLDLESFLNEVQAVDADGTTDTLHNGDLGREGDAVIDDQILTDAEDLICGGVSIRDEEESDQVQPGMAETFDVPEDKPVILRADG